MSKALYTKYRPQTFDEVIGQDVAVQILKKSIEKKKINHAYLFYGIRGTGKTTLARIFAKTINCESKINKNPCNLCESCKSVNNNSQIDVIEMDAASNNGVDEIRDLTEKANYATTFSKYKVYIIDEVHMLSKSAFNALLKTLEEPPTNTIFLLATTEINRIPDTILSRTVVINLQLVKIREIVNQLSNILDVEEKIYNTKALEYIASLSEGSVRDAISYLETILLFSDKVTKENVIKALGIIDIEKLEMSLLKGEDVSIMIDESINGRRLIIMMIDLLIKLIANGNESFKKMLSKLTDGFISIKDPMLLNKFIKSVLIEQDFFKINSLDNANKENEITIENESEEFVKEKVNIQDVLRTQFEQGTREARVMLGEQVTEEFIKEENKYVADISDVKFEQGSVMTKEVLEDDKKEQIDKNTNSLLNENSLVIENDRHVGDVSDIEKNKEQSLSVSDVKFEQGSVITKEVLEDDKKQKTDTKKMDNLIIEKSIHEIEYEPFSFDSKDYVYTMLNGDEMILSSVKNKWILLRTVEAKGREKSIINLLLESQPLIATKDSVILGLKDDFVIEELKKVVNSEMMKNIIKRIFGRVIIFMPTNEKNWSKLIEIAKKVREKGVEIQFSLNPKTFFKKEKNKEIELAKSLFGDKLVTA